MSSYYNILAAPPHPRKSVLKFSEKSQNLMNCLTQFRIYCLKCKVKTLTDNAEYVITKNSRNMIKGTCSTCKTRKNQFIKNGSITRSRFLNDAIGKLGDLDIELHLASDKGENVTNESFNKL